MRYSSVSIAALSHVLPERVTTSEELEHRLAPLYARLKLSTGRIELMSGIRERRFFAPGTPPSTISARAGAEALAKSGIERDRIGLVVHAAVCRDFLEPATASVVHAKLELSERCAAWDLSNACLGFANAMTVAAGEIERGAIDAALVVAGEDGGALVEETIRALTQDPRAGRAELKRAHASLTIGGGGAACVLARSDLVRDAPEASGAMQLVASVSLADTTAHELCRGGVRAGNEGPLMDTDAEALLRAGNALAARTWPRFLAEVGWRAEDVDRVVTHQVGSAHTRMLFETLGLDLARDFPTYPTLGNVGSVSLPLSFSLAREQGVVRAGDRVALLGIGSGLHCAMLGVRC